MNIGLVVGIPAETPSRNVQHKKKKSIEENCRPYRKMKLPEKLNHNRLLTNVFPLLTKCSSNDL